MHVWVNWNFISKPNWKWTFAENHRAKIHISAISNVFPHQVHVRAKLKLHPRAENGRPHQTENCRAEMHLSAFVHRMHVRAEPKLHFETKLKYPPTAKAHTEMCENASIEIIRRHFLSSWRTFSAFLRSCVLSAIIRAATDFSRDWWEIMKLVKIRDSLHFNP